MERIDFDNVSVGDELVFATADNGFTGSGNFVDRSGIVTGKDGRPAPSGKTLRYLSRGDIGRWFGVGGETVRKWQERHGAGGDGGYRPFPHPDVLLDRSPGWSPHREAEIRAWYKGRPGRGAGGGRPRTRQPE